MKTQVTIWSRDPAATAYGDKPDASYAGRVAEDEIYAERNDDERAKKLAGVIGGFGLACGYCGVCIGTGMWSAIAFWFGISAAVVAVAVYRAGEM